ncbi:MAG: FAD-binding protein [Deltaproteobacteria bacterium]|jgi:glycolate oxidase|nr:FAD-binding protein [Deltaproteobacteria bacterium]
MSIPRSLTSDFRKVLGEDSVFTEDADLLSYAYDSAVLEQRKPAVVLAPSTRELLGRAVGMCYRADLPITVRGSGTNLSGATVPEPGDSAVILTSKLNRILEINQRDLYALVEPGVVTARLARAVAAQGLFYPPDPGSQEVSTLGGNVALNAGGLRGLKYGVTKDYLMGMELFDHGGELVKTGSRTVKCVTGYNLAGLMLASEGTLGVFSTLILKLLPPPRASRAMLAVFERFREAAEAVAEIVAARILPCTLEFMDTRCIRAVESFKHIGLPVDAGAILLIEVDGGSSEGVLSDANEVKVVCAKCGASEIREARDPGEKARIWEARRNALPALARLRPTTVLEDATVPRSRVPDMVEAVADLASRHRLEVGVFGHAGDGNLHPTILCDRRDPEEFARVEEMVDGIFETALNLQGTLSGEHGIGLAKAKWMEKETNRATVEFSKRIRKALDPKGLLNAGKKII